MTKPLQEPSLLILSAVASGPKHGYAIIGDVEASSEGRVRLRAGTLYTALDRLAEDGMIEVDREEVVNGRHRRYYRITGTGAARLADEVARLRQLARVASRSLKLGGLGT